MRRIAPLSGALVVLALLVGINSGSATAATKCGDYKKADKVVADGLSCGDAKKVVRKWLKLCNTEDLCVIDVGRLGEEFSCKGRTISANKAKIKCKGRESGDRVKFKAPV